MQRFDRETRSCFPRRTAVLALSAGIAGMALFAGAGALAAQ
jgi:hypothetical protein